MPTIALASAIFAKTAIAGYAITSVVGAKTDASVVCIDFRDEDVPGQGNPVELFSIGAKTTGNATVPGAARTFTVNLYWSAEELSPADLLNIGTILSDRKITTGPQTLPNSANAIRQWELFGASLILAPFLYITLDHTTVDASANVAVDVFVNRVP